MHGLAHVSCDCYSSTDICAIPRQTGERHALRRAAVPTQCITTATTTCGSHTRATDRSHQHPYRFCATTFQLTKPRPLRAYTDKLLSVRKHIISLFTSQNVHLIPSGAHLFRLWRTALAPADSSTMHPRRLHLEPQSATAKALSFQEGLYLADAPRI
jgi:hypothetical protein